MNLFIHKIINSFVLLEWKFSISYLKFFYYIRLIIIYNIFFYNLNIGYFMKKKNVRSFITSMKDIAWNETKGFLSIAQLLPINDRYSNNQKKKKIN